MMPRYLLDTNVLSEAKRLQPNQNVMKNLKTYTGEIATATLVIHELLFGCLRLPPSKKRQNLEHYINNVILKNLPLFDYDLKSAAYHAQERARLSKLGKSPAFVDGQIASIASTNNLTLVTNNVDDFQYFNGLVVENWFL